MDFGCRSCRQWRQGFAGVVVVLGCDVSPLLVSVEARRGAILRRETQDFAGWINCAEGSGVEPKTTGSRIGHLSVS